MKAVLIDTGPIVALIDRGDADHTPCVQQTKQLRGSLLSTWPVITEAMYLLADVPEGQDALLGKVESGDIEIAALTAEDVAPMRQLIRKYQDLPMDFADASVVRVAQRDGLDTVFTLYRTDFQVYRRDRGRPFRIIP